MENFKNFYTQKTGETFDKYNVVLFVGDYNPITHDEYSRIQQFVDKVIKHPTYTKLFDNSVDIGLIMDADKDEEKYTIEKKYNLNFDERNYITTKIFGLKALPLALENLELAQAISIDNSSKLDEALFKITEDIKKFFHKNNILIVLRQQDTNIQEAFKLIKRDYEANEQLESKIDFVFFNHVPYIPKSISIPCRGEMIKSIVLLNSDKPRPEDLKSFAAKYGLSEFIDDIRRIHFKTEGYRYSLAFELVFPQLNLFSGQDDASKEANFVFIMDLLKEMYLKTPS